MMRARWLFASTLAAGSLLGAEADLRLVQAARHQGAAAVQTLLSDGADPNAAEPDGTSALHWAVHEDDLESAKLLIRRNANPKAANRYGMTPLSLACRNGSVAMVELLLTAGADPNSTLPGGETPLMTAARAGSVATVRALIARGADVHAKEPKFGQTALMWAAADGHAETVQALVAAGADYRVRTPLGFTAFLFAVREGQIAVARTLLKAGANVNETVQPVLGPGVKGALGRGPRPGTSALVLAVTNAHYELASVLLDAGADPNAAATGYTALHAITNARKPGGGDNDPPPQGSGSLSSIAMVRKLAAKGADLNARMTRKVNFGLTSLNTAGATPFLLAAKTADAELMRVLAELGADPKIPNADGANAMIVAAGLGTRSPGEDAGTEEEVVEALQVAFDLGVDINAVDNNGETAMHGAAYKNLPGAVEFLASHGARIEIWNRRNKQGWTPLRIAEGYRFGNFKPSQVTIDAFHRVMKAAGVPITSDGAGNLVTWK